MKTVFKKTLCFTVTTTLCLVFLFAVTGCDKLENPDVDDLYLKIENVSGKIENASKYNNIVGIKLIWFESVSKYSILARGDRENGGFTIALPKTLDQNCLNALNISGFHINIAVPSTLNVSNNNVKVFTLSNYCGVDKVGNVVAYFRPSAIDENGNVKDVYFTYVDSDVTISGYTESRFTVIPTENYTGPGEWKQTTTYSIEWKKGWNVWWISRNWHTPTATVTERYSTNPVNNLKWDGEENQSHFNIN